MSELQQLTFRDWAFRIFAIMGFAALYFAAAHLGLQLATLQENASPVWPASGLAVALLVWRRRQFWPAIWLGAFAANLATSAPVWVAAVIATGNTLEAVVGAVVIVYLLKAQSEWKVIFRVTAFAFGALLGGSISSCLGPAALALSGQLKWSDFQSVALTWFVGDILGILVVTPLLMEIGGADRLLDRVRAPARALEYLVFAGVLGALAYGIFLTTFGFHQLFLLFPLLLWASARFGRTHLRVLVLLISIVAIGGTVLGVGPFHSGSLNQNLVSLQLFLAALALTGICLAELTESTSFRLPAVALLVSWALSGMMFSHFENSVLDRDVQHFQRLVREAQDHINERVTLYEDALLGGASLVASVPVVSAKAWRSYVQSFRLQERYPAVIGMALMWPVKAGEELAFQKRYRQINQSDLKIVQRTAPGGIARPENSDHYVVVYVEPLERNREALGLDVASEGVGRVAAEQARDLGVAVASGNVPLLQDQPHRPGFILYLAFYRQGQALNSVEERRQALLGWVSVPFVVENFFRGSIGSPASELEFTVLDEGESAPIYFSGDSSGPSKKFEMTSSIELGLRKFRIGWDRSQGFISSHDTTSAWVAAVGALMSILIAMVVSVLQSLGLRAEEIAQRRTAELAASESALRMATRRMETLIASSPMGILCTDLNMRITLWNPACERIFGYPTEEVIGKDLPFVPDHMMPEARANFEMIRGAVKPFFFTAERRRKGGDVIYTSTALMPIHNEAGVLEGAMSVIVDITEERRAQKALESERAAAIQNARMAAIGEMAGGIAHEINNPLAIIGGQATFLRMDMEANGGVLDPLKAATSLQKIEAVVFRISKIIKGLRTFSRHTDFEPKQKRDVSELVTETLEFCQERFRNHGVRLEVNRRPALTVECQGVQISQVLLNLLNNSFDAVVGLPDPWIRLDVTTRENKAIISVTDNGHGIPAHLTERIMEPFFTTKPVGQGTGLGLSIAKGIVERHGGRLLVDTVAIHTRIVIELPLTATTEAG